MILTTYKLVDERILQLFYWPNVIKSQRRFG